MVSWHAWVSIAFLFYKHGWECMLASDEDTVHGALAWYCDAVDEYVISKSSCPLAGVPKIICDSVYVLRHTKGNAKNSLTGFVDLESLEVIYNWTEALKGMVVSMFSQETCMPTDR